MPFPSAASTVEDRIVPSSSASELYRALGGWITSATPDYLFGFDGITDDYTDMSRKPVSPARSSPGRRPGRRRATCRRGRPKSTAVRQDLYGTRSRDFDSVTQSSYRRIDCEGSLAGLSSVRTISGTTTYRQPRDPDQFTTVRRILQRLKIKLFLLRRISQTISCRRRLARTA